MEFSSHEVEIWLGNDFTSSDKKMSRDILYHHQLYTKYVLYKLFIYNLQKV